jgi:hypothetical protein
MKRLTDAEKCCKVVETLVSDDLCEDIEFRIGVHNDYKISKHEAELLNNKLSKIYEYTHAANKHSCQTSHEDWLVAMQKTYKSMKRRGCF